MSTSLTLAVLVTHGTEDSRVLDVGCGIGGPARYLAHSYGCRVDGIDLTAELIETGRMLTERHHLVGAGDHDRRYFQTQRFGGLEIDDQFVARRPAP